jgi:hypothetical protein
MQKTLTEGNEENEDSMKGASAEDSLECFRGYTFVPFVIFCKKWAPGSNDFLSPEFFSRLFA